MVSQPLPGAACSNAWHWIHEEMFPNIQSKPPLAQLEAISSMHIYTYTHGKPHRSQTHTQSTHANRDNTNSLLLSGWAGWKSTSENIYIYVQYVCRIPPAAGLRHSVCPVAGPWISVSPVAGTWTYKPPRP